MDFCDVTFTATVVREPETAVTSKGSVTTITAKGELSYGRDGTRQQFYVVEVWETLVAKFQVKVGKKYLFKGLELSTRSWDDPETGQKRTKTVLKPTLTSVCIPMDGSVALGMDAMDDEGMPRRRPEPRAPQARETPRARPTPPPSRPATRSTSNDIFDDDEVPF